MALAFGMVHYIGKASPVGEWESVLVTVAPSKGGYYAEAVRVQDMPEYLATYAETIRGLKVSYHVRGHIADHPAQPIVFHWLVNRTMESAPALARFFCPEEPQPPAQAWRSEARPTQAADGRAFCPRTTQAPQETPAGETVN